MTNENNAYANAIEKIKQMAIDGVEVKPYKTPDGKYFVFSKGEDGKIEAQCLDVEARFAPDTMFVNTLTAFVNYLKAAIKNREIVSTLYINIISPTKVCAYSPLTKFGERDTVATADRYNFTPFNFGCKYDFESFVVALRSKFSESDGTKALLECLRKVTSSNEVGTEDNGITQVVTAKNGLHLNAGVQVTPIWALKPHRTFTEIEQPESLFLLRMTQSGDSTQYALHETDGNAWAVSAMNSIGDWLRAKLAEEIKEGKIFVL